MEKNDKALTKIDQINEFFGIEDANNTVFEISHDPQTNEKKLTLKKGSWSDEEPWFGIDESGELHTMVSLKSLNNLIRVAKGAIAENFNLKLERSILQQAPVDFGDAWIVCMDEIRKITSENPSIKKINLDLDAIVSRVKQSHPNLFIDIEELVRSRNGKH
ncbi:MULTISPECIES: DUF2603 domain-containing protein [unclassified Campylobacter]|uniref:DUF2603 domain-containing protein n=1 Tax=unclassified Campylobacter TaxID=2593542 RepID=UPI0022E9A014|nr:MULTISPECIES: DUF2603 domain-containing protein [unclassified Campylobacter]MDA3062286.1 DUF2603 domain-containing protein [Campylobacter sp. JMF_14 EL1]MDA3073595.1 DUF2603 domain-containing protein [Campylobacter sp. JMF_10 EL2]